MLFYLKRLCHIETTMSNYNLHSYSGSPNRHSLQGQNSVVSPGFLPLTHTGDSPSNPPSHVYHSQASIKDQHSVQQYALSKWPTLQLQLPHCLWGACHFTRGLLFSVKSMERQPLTSVNRNVCWKPAECIQSLLTTELEKHKCTICSNYWLSL